MDAENRLKRARLEVTCPVCVNYFSDPGTLQGGHSFCDSCLQRCWEETAKCPQSGLMVDCDFHPSRTLSNLVEVVRDWEVSAEREREALAWPAECKRHEQPLDLFCRDDQAPVCAECNRSQEHVGHSVVPVEEAAREYKDQIDGHLKILRRGSLRMLSAETATKNKMELLLEEITRKKQKQQNDFKQLRTFLDAEERLFTAQMDELQSEVRQKMGLLVALLHKTLSSHRRIIQELEEKRQQPASELLRGIRNTFQRYEERERFKVRANFLRGMSHRLLRSSDLIAFLGGLMKQFKDAVNFGFPLRPGKSKDLLKDLNYEMLSVSLGFNGILQSLQPSMGQLKVNGEHFLANVYTFCPWSRITLDPDTAHPTLVVSEDRRSVRWGNIAQALPNTPERFDSVTAVLGCEEFTASRHSWEVIVRDAECWGLGVARKSVARQGLQEIGSEEGFWGIEINGAQCSDFKRQSTLLCGKPDRIQVALNYPGQEVTFYVAENKPLVCGLSYAAFAGEPLVPFFCLRGEGQLAFSP